MIKTELDILKTAINKRSALYHVMELDESYFTDIKTITLFKTIQELHENNIDIDMPVVIAKLTDQGNFEKAGGTELIKLLSSGLTAVNIKYLIETIKKKHSESKFIILAKKIFESIKQDNMSIDEISQLINKTVQDINNVSTDDFMTTKDFKNTNLDTFFQQHSGTNTGIIEVDRVLNKLYNGQLIVIGARPKVGKSALALNIALNQIGSVLFYSLEMTRRELYGRILSNKTDIPAGRIEEKNLSGDEIKKILKAQSEYKSDITIFDKTQSINKISNSIKKFSAIKKPALIIVDYLQLITGGNGENRNLQISDITGQFKRLAMFLDVPIILLSQLSRGVEKAGRKPILSDLRDSGAIEQDADVIIFLHEESELTGIIEFIIAGNRKGKVGSVDLYFNKKYMQVR